MMMTILCLASIPSAGAICRRANGQHLFKKKKKKKQNGNHHLCFHFLSVKRQIDRQHQGYIWDLELYILSVTYLDRGSSKVWQLFDVLTLFSNDGSHCKRWDEQVNRLRLWMSLLGKNMSVLLYVCDLLGQLRTTCSSPVTNAQMQTVDLAKAGQFFKATMELMPST